MALAPGSVAMVVKIETQGVFASRVRSSARCRPWTKCFSRRTCRRVMALALVSGASDDAQAAKTVRNT